jgi:predicted DNA-binding protein
MTSQLIVRLDPDQKSRFQKLAKNEGKSSSEVVRNLIEAYIQERDIKGAIDDLWNRIGTDLKQKGVTPKDVNQAIRDVRAAKR